MVEFNLEKESLWRLQSDCKDMADALYSESFYSTMRKVLTKELWRRYETQAFGRLIEFDSLAEFLTNEDGLAWPSVDEVLRMIAIVATGHEPIPTRPNGCPGEAIRAAANELLGLLEQENLGVTPPAQRLAEAALAVPAEAEFASDGNPHGNPDIVRVNATEGGNSAAYLAARLKKAGRDDLLEQIGPERQFKSVRAAAIEAGIIKPVATIRVTSPEAIANRLVQHLKPDDLARLVALLSEHLTA